VEREKRSRRNQSDSIEKNKKTSLINLFINQQKQHYATVSTNFDFSGALSGALGHTGTERAGE
jgi:hypothetical protein